MPLEEYEGAKTAFQNGAGLRLPIVPQAGELINVRTQLVEAGIPPDNASAGKRCKSVPIEKEAETRRPVRRLRQFPIEATPYRSRRD